MGKHSAKSSRKERKAERKLSRGRSTGGRATGTLEPAPTMRVHRERRKRIRRRILYGLLTLVILGILAAGGWAYAFMNSVGNDLNEGIVEDEAVQDALVDREPHEPFTILLLGSDVRPWEEEARADTIILARVDPQAGKVWMISIPRDTRAEIPGYGVSKINAANYHGGAALVIETVEDYLGVPINHYMEIDFSGFQAIVDALGGVWIDVPVEIDDVRAASHSPGYRAAHIDPGYQLLDGEHALTFVRSRDFIDADWGRMRNQQLFFRELASQSTRFENILRLPTVVREFARNATTDLSVTELLEVAQDMRGLGEGGIQTATLPGEWRSPYVIVDDAEKQRLVDAMLAGQDFEPTETEVALLPQDISVAVRNGAGIGGVAAEGATILEDVGFDIAEIGNANQFVYDETLVIYDEEEDEAAASLVFDELGIGAVVQSRGMYSFGTDVLVVIGKDWGDSGAEKRPKLSAF